MKRQVRISNNNLPTFLNVYWANQIMMSLAIQAVGGVRMQTFLWLPFFVSALPTLSWFKSLTRPLRKHFKFVIDKLLKDKICPDMWPRIGLALATQVGLPSTTCGF